VDTAEEDLKAILDEGSRMKKLLGKDIKKQRIVKEKLMLHKMKVKNEHQKLQNESNSYVNKNSLRQRDVQELGREIEAMKQDQLAIMDDLELI